MTMFIFILLVVIISTFVAVTAAVVLNLVVNVVRTVVVRTDDTNNTNTDVDLDGVEVEVDELDVDWGVPMPLLPHAVDQLCAYMDTVNTVVISDLPIHEQVADEMLLASCDVSDMTPIVVGSTPLDYNDYTTVPTSVALAVHAGDTWLTGVVAQVTGLAHTIDAIVEEYYDRVQWMIRIMK